MGYKYPRSYSVAFFPTFPRPALWLNTLGGCFFREDWREGAKEGDIWWLKVPTESGILHYLIVSSSGGLPGPQERILRPGGTRGMS
ncbi:unnamed protein product [Calypogeia fissa]